MLNNFFGNQQQQNLMLQDSKALKQQITKELEHQKQLENSFKQNLARNEKLRELNNQLEQQGFNLTGINVFPKSNSTGNFQLSYMNRSGATAEIRGKLLNNSMKLVIDTPQIRQRMLSALYNNSQFRQISQMLASQGYKLRNLSIKLDYNNTSINLSYSNGKLNTTVSALLNNSTVKEISVKKEQARKRTIWPVIVLILTLVSSLLVLAYYLKRKNNRHTNIALVPDKKEDFDYGKEALRLLRKAKRLAESKKTKEAFAEIARSVRYYLIHKYGLNKEMTNYEITTILQDKEPQIKELIQVLNICTLVEFARFRPKRNDFSNTYQLAKKIILGK